VLQGLKGKLIYQQLQGVVVDRTIDFDKILGYRIARIEQKHLRSYCAYYKGATDDRKQHFQGTQTWIGLRT